MAGLGTATAVLLGTFLTLNEEEVAHDVGAFDMGVAGLAALVTVGDDLVADAFAHALVEDEVLAAKLVQQALLPGVVGILDDATFKLIDLIEAFVLVVGRGFFAANTAVQYIPMCLSRWGSRISSTMGSESRKVSTSG